jgi:histidinol-phosphate aminotransferase
MKPYIAGFQPQEEGWIKLNTNENPYPVDINVDLDLGSLRLYPDPDSTGLCRAIAQKFNVMPENVFCGNGSDEVLALAFQAFYAGQKVTMPDISYGFYPVWAKAYGLLPELIHLKDWEIRWSEYTGNCVIANPNAPTGLAVNISEIPQRGIVIIDEAYIDFAHAASAIDLTKKYDNLLVVRTFSKSYSLAGLRVGFAIGNVKLIQRLKLYKDCFNSYPLDTFAQRIAEAAIKQPPNTDEVIKTRQWMKTQIPCLDSQANFLFWEVADSKKMYEHLLENKILVRYWERFPNHLRVSMGTKEEMEEFLCCARRLKLK